jgi:hypothetical protein
MSYSLDFALTLGTAALTLAAQVVDSAGSNVGAAVTTGFVDIGSGFYLWHASIAAAQRGGVKFYEIATPATILGFAAINPEEAEYTDVATSSREVSGAAATALNTAIPGSPTTDSINERVVTMDGTVATNLDAKISTRAIAGDAMTLVNDAITAAKIAADAIGSSELAATAVSEIALAVSGTDTTATLTELLRHLLRIERMLPQFGRR